MQPLGDQTSDKPTSDPIAELEDKMAETAPAELKLNIVPAPEKPELEAPALAPAAPSNPVVGDTSIPKLQPFKRTDFTTTPAPAQSAPKPSLSMDGISGVRPQPSAERFSARPMITETETTPPAPENSSPESVSGSAPLSAASTSDQNSFQPVVFGGGNGNSSNNGGNFNSGSLAPYSPVPARHSRMTKILRIALPILVVLVLAGSYVFGMYLPNKPENVFKTGLTRTGMAFDKLTTAGVDTSKLDAIKKIELSGNMTITGPDGKQSGSFSSHYDDSKSDSSLTYKPTAAKQGFSLQALTDLASGQTYPDMYFKVSGLSVLGLDQQAPQLVQYDGKWINISPAFLQSVIPADFAAQQTTSQSTFTPHDAAELTKAVVTTTREYVFTNDPNKNVLVNKSFKGKEQIDGNISADHYVVVINKPHAKDFCKALITNVMATNGFKDIPGVPTENLDDTKTNAIKSCQDSVQNDIKDSSSFDMWVDTKNKLIAKIRIADETDVTTYVEIGQTYTTGSVLPVYVVYHSDRNHYHVTFSANIDLDKSTTKLSLDGTNGTGKDKWTYAATATFKPYEGALKITKPTDSIPVEKVLQTLGIDPTQLIVPPDSSSTSGSVTGGIQVKAKDTERQTDLKALQGQLEAYYATKGMYPKLEEINSVTWRNQNMKGLDTEALKDPDGTDATLAATPSAKQYGYVAANCDAFKGCQTYTLTAILSDGKTFTLTSL